MVKIREAIDHYATRRPGLTESIQQANSGIRAYLTSTLQGVAYNDVRRIEMMNRNDRLMMQYLRWIELLIGKEYLAVLRRKSINPLPNSNNQCVQYFHTALGYNAVARSKKTGAPSLGKEAMYKLRLAHDNPVIDVILAYRKKAKETGTYLKFEPWLTHAT